MRDFRPPLVIVGIAFPRHDAAVKQLALLKDKGQNILFERRFYEQLIEVIRFRGGALNLRCLLEKLESMFSVIISSEVNSPYDKFIDRIFAQDLAAGS